MGEWDLAGEFQAHRRRLFGLAYRLLRSAANAEDMVQEAFLRWAGADRAVIEAPRAWSAKTVTNLCLNHVNSARVRREQYVGPWLPDPVCTEDGMLGPLEQAQQRELVSVALLSSREQLTPVERAVFVLRAAFGYEHRSIAETVGCSPANSRQLYRRATHRLQEERARFAPDRDTWRLLVERFVRSPSPKLRNAVTEAASSNSGDDATAAASSTIPGSTYCTTGVLLRRMPAALVGAGAAGGAVWAHQLTGAVS